MVSRFRQVVALSVAGSMFVSTSAMAAPVSAAPVQPINSWAALSVLSSGAPAAALCGSAAVTAAAQGAGGCVLPATDAPAPAPVAEEGPPPPIPVPPIAAPSSFNLGVSPLLLALGAVAAGAALYFLVIKKKHSSSPA